MKVKICGLQSLADVQLVNKFLPDYAGFIFAPSKRQVSRRQVCEFVQVLKREIIPVGVFVNLPLLELQEVVEASKIRIIQLHGDETEKYLQQVKQSFPQLEVWRAVRATSQSELSRGMDSCADKFLLDSFVQGEYGGSGKLANWEILSGLEFDKPIFLAGGLNIDNIMEACELNNIWGVDVSSGVETNSVKDVAKVELFIKLVKNKL